MLTRFRWLGDTVINYRLPIPRRWAAIRSSKLRFMFLLQHFLSPFELMLLWASTEHRWHVQRTNSMTGTSSLYQRYNYRLQIIGFVSTVVFDDCRCRKFDWILLLSFRGRFRWFEVPAWLAHEHHVAPDIGLNKRPPSEHLLPTNFFIQLRVYKSSSERRAPAYLKAPTKVQELSARTHNCVPCPHRLPGKNTEF